MPIRLFGNREDPFFRLLNQTATTVHEGTVALQGMVGDLGDAAAHAGQIKVLEDAADETTHRVIALLHKTFVTTLEREDIHRLATTLDDILDLSLATADRILLYRVTEAPLLVGMVDALVGAAEFCRLGVAGVLRAASPQSLSRGGG